MLAPAARWSGWVGSTAIVTSSGLVEPGLLTRTLGCWALAGEGWQVEPAAARRPIRWAKWRRRMAGRRRPQGGQADPKGSLEVARTHLNRFDWSRVLTEYLPSKRGGEYHPGGQGRVLFEEETPWDSLDSRKTRNGPPTSRCTTSTPTWPKTGRSSVRSGCATSTTRSTSPPRTRTSCSPGP